MGKNKRRTPEQRRRRMRRKARLADARQWLPAHQGTDLMEAYEHWYGVDRLCAIRELRLLGVAISEEYEALVLDSFKQRARARTAERAAKRAANQRAARTRVPLRYPYGGAAPIDGSWNGDDGDASTVWDEVSLDAVAKLAPDRSAGDEHWQIEDTLLKDACFLDLRMIETKIVHLDEARVRVRLTLEDDPDVLARRAWGLIFAIGMFSFADADADADAIDHHEWMADDMLRCLSFDRGRLRFDADHVGGRCMQTRIEIDGEGKITLETVDRGEAARQWISKLQDMQAMPAVEGGEDGASLDPLPF